MRGVMAGYCKDDTDRVVAAIDRLTRAVLWQGIIASNLDNPRAARLMTNSDMDYAMRRQLADLEKKP